MGYLGIDLGTSAVKISYLDEEAKIQQSVSRSYPISYPKEGWAEQNPEDWWTAILSGIAEIVETDSYQGIRAIGVGGQMHGLVVLDADEQVIRPAILWNDTRTSAETTYLNQVIGQSALLEETGNIAYAGFTAPKLLWMKKQEPEQYQKIRHILLPKDYIVFRLTGQFATDYSDASGTLLLNVRQRTWSQKLLEICQLDPVVLPRLLESSDLAGESRKELNQAWKLEKPALVVAGAGDNAAAALSVGAVEEGDCNISLGTSGTVFMPARRFLQDEKSSLHAFADASGQFHLMSCTLSAASCYKWWMDQILEKPESTTLSTKEAVRHQALYFMPYLMGERSPLNDEAVRGAFLGLSPRVNWQHMIYAIYEGVAFSLRDCVEIAKSMGLAIDQVSLVGGGSKSAIWAQMMANVLNRPLLLPEGERGPGHGAALLAYACYHKLPIGRLAKDQARFSKTYRPQAEEVPYYEKKYRRFQKLYPALRDFYQQG